MSHITTDTRRAAIPASRARRQASPAATVAMPVPAPSRWASRAALAAVIAPAVFVTVMMVLGLVTPGYNWVARYASELSIGHLGWIMIANFIVFGAAELALAAALARTITGRPSGRAATAAVGVLAAAFVVLGVFVTDPAKLVTGAHTVHGTIHEMMAVVVFFIATPTAGLAMARRYRHRRGFARYCVLTAIATPVLLVITFLSGGLLGLTERITIAVIMAWLTTAAARLYLDTRRPAGPPAPQQPSDTTA